MVVPGSNCMLFLPLALLVFPPFTFLSRSPFFRTACAAPFTTLFPNPLTISLRTHLQGYEVICEDDNLANLFEIEAGFAYLMRIHAMCGAPPASDPKSHGKSRISCSYGSAIFLQNLHKDKALEIPCLTLGEQAKHLQKTCAPGYGMPWAWQVIAGKFVWEANGYEIEIHHSDNC